MDHQQGRFRTYITKRFRNDAATECRLIGAFIGLVSIILPWGSIIFRDRMTYATLEVISHNPLSLLGSNDSLMIVGASLFVSCTLLAFMERLASLGQLAGWLLILYGLPAYLSAIAIPAWVEGATKDITLLNVGMLLGLLSAALVLMSILVERKQHRFPHEELLPNDQRPVVRYEWMQQGSPPRNRSR